MHELRRSYRFDYLPAGFFSRLLVHLLQVVDSPLYWKHGIVLLQSNNNTRSKANQPCDGSSGGRSSSVAMASPAAARMASPSFSLSTASVLSSSPHMRELRRSGLDFDIFQNGGSGRRGQGLGIKKKQKKEKVKQRKESAEQSARGSGKESLGGSRAGQPDLDKDKLKDEQRALLEEFPEKSMLKVQVYGANPGKLLRLIEANIEDLAINWFRVKSQVLVPCCHCIALRKHKLAKTTLYASHKLKSTGKRSAADGLTHEDELIEVGMGEAQNDDDEPFLFSLEECLRAITKRRRVLYCQAGRLVPIDNSARQRGRRKSTSKIYLEGEDLPAVRLDNLVPDLSLADLQGFEIDYSEIKIMSQIALGPFAVVHSAIYRGEYVAVKEFRILPSDSPDEESPYVSEEEILSVFNEFRSEAWLMTLLDHRNLVKLEGICRGPFSLVMEFLSQGTLYDYVHARGQLSWDEVLSIARDIAEGMNHLHSHSPPIIHRDLKSTNVMLSNGVAKVSDFGLSTAHSLFVKGRVVDNPMWLAVEVIRGEAFSLKSDVYSYGIILWELITCQPPFREHLEASMFWFDLEQKIMNGLRPAVPESCPEAYAELMRECWHENVSVRPSFNQILKRLASMSKCSPCPLFEAAPTPESVPVSAPAPRFVHIPSAQALVPQHQRASANPLASSSYASAGASAWHTASKQQAKANLVMSLNTLDSDNYLSPPDSSATWRCLLRPSHSGAVQCLLGVEGHVWAGCRDGTIRVWDQCGSVVWDMRAHHRQRINALSFCGGYVCSASSDHTVGLWDVHTFKRHRRLNGHWEEVTCLANVGQELWSGSLDGSIRVWSRKWSCRRMLALESPVRAMLVHDGLVWVATDRGVSLFDAISTLKVNEILYSNQEVGDRLWQGAVRCMCRVDLTDEVWMGTTAGQLYVFRVRDVWEGKGESEHKTPNPSWAYHTVASPRRDDGDASAGNSPTGKRLQDETGGGEEESSGDEDNDRQVTSMLAVGGLVWIGGRRGDLAAFDAASRTQRLHFDLYHKDALTCLFAVPPSARKADRLPTFRERQHVQMRKQAEQQDAATKGKQKVDDDNNGIGNNHSASDKADKNVEAEALEAEEESASVWKREGAGGGIVWTGSWDREVSLINVDDLIMASQDADAGGAATTARAKRHGVYAPTAFLPASSLPAHLGFVGRH